MSEMPCRIAIFGNHSCSNRGDCAIARGLIDWIRQLQPEADITLFTRYPESAKLFLGQSSKIEQDPLEKYYARKRGKTELLWKALLKRFLALYLVTPLWRIFGLPAAHKSFVDELKQYDLFIQVGGSFFVDVYGISQFEGLLLARLSGIPVICCGHSVGPFRGRIYRYVASKAFSSGAHWLLREDESLGLMEQFRIPAEYAQLSGDTAWLIPDDIPAPNVPNSESRPAIGITVRALAPFDQVLGLEQRLYENQVAIVADALVDKGYSVFFASTCTGLEGYWRDDRIVALRILRNMKSSSFATVVMDEWSDLELGAFLGSCRFVIATRLHSAILSMRFGTPAVVLGYEHKSAGICRTLGVEELNYPLDHTFSSAKIMERLENLEENEAFYRERIAVSVERELDRITTAQKAVMGSILTRALQQH